MSFLVRKIDKGKWLENDILNGADVAADAITNCMKTKGNKLSAWEISTQADVEDAVLAIISAGDHIETIHVIIMDRQHLAGQGIACTQEEGWTPVDQLKKTHYEIDNLTYPKLGIIAQYTVEIFKNDLVLRYTEAEIKRILKKAVSAKRLDPLNLKSSISSKLQ